MFRPSANSMMINIICQETLSETLEDWIIANNNSIDMCVLKSILFMLIYTLYAVTNKYPSFKHNDLHTANILFWRDPNYKSSGPQKFIKINACNKVFYVPYYGIIPKIIDFDLSSLDEIGANGHNQYANDASIMMQSIYECFTAHVTNMTDITKLLAELDPHTLHTSHLIFSEIEQINVNQILLLSVWDEYTMTKKKKSQIYAEYFARD